MCTQKVNFLSTGEGVDCSKYNLCLCLIQYLHLRGGVE